MITTKALFGILTISLALAGQVQAQLFLTNGLVAHYPFNGNANDATGNGNNGTVYGAGVSFTADRFGIPSSCCGFDGTVSYIQITQTPNLIAVTNRTISAWANMTGYSTVSCCAADIISKYDSSLGNFYLRMNFTATNPIPTFGLYSLNGQGKSITSSSVSTNNWINLVATWDGTTACLYQNGKLASSQACSTPGVWNSTTLRIGRHGGDDGNPLHYYLWKGFIDDVRIYNRALSTNEVQQLYAFESQPVVSLRKAVSPSFSNLYLGTNYQLQVSTDLNTWTNNGAAFAPTNTVMDYPQYWDVANWNSLYFRLHVAP